MRSPPFFPPNNSLHALARAGAVGDSAARSEALPPCTGGAVGLKACRSVLSSRHREKDGGREDEEERGLVCRLRQEGEVRTRDGGEGV
jgi:hypothetical protein